MIQTHRTVHLANGSRVILTRVQRRTAEEAIRLGVRVGLTLGQDADPRVLLDHLPPTRRGLWYWVSKYQLEMARLRSNRPK